jgi:hypothetical protein
MNSCVGFPKTCFDQKAILGKNWMPYQLRLAFARNAEPSASEKNKRVALEDFHKVTDFIFGADC